MTITILHKYLYHDIKQLTTRYAEARNMDAETRDMAQIGDGQSDKELIMRLIITGVSRMKTVSYTHSPSPRDRQKSRMPSSA